MRHTNLSSATSEAHKKAKGGKISYFVYGEKGRYVVSSEKPESELRYIQVTPTGNEWTWSYDPSAKEWRKSRLGWIGMRAEESKFDHGDAIQEECFEEAEPDQIEEESRYEGPKMKGRRPSEFSIRVTSDGNWTLSCTTDKSFIPAHGRARNPETAWRAAHKAAVEIAGWK